MLINEFDIGPFTIRPTGRFNNDQLFTIEYSDREMRANVPATPGTQREVIEQLAGTLSDAVSELKGRHSSHLISLVNADGEGLASFKTESCVLPGMTAGLIDDRSDYWLCSEDRLYSIDVTLNQYARLRAEYELPERAWITELLPEDVMTQDAQEWRAPTSSELRHIVGIGSLTGISGAKAAALVGISAQNFRKYTASESAKHRQSISFAAWHMLLHRLGIQRFAGDQL